MALDAPAPLYYDTNATQTANTYNPQDDMASLVASTSNGGFPGLSTQEQYQHQQYQQAQQLHAQAQAAAVAQQQQQVPQLPQSLAGVGRRHRTVPAKTFKCTGFGDCAMVFSRSEHLARHVRKHTGERPFACHCSKQFSRLDNLRQHAQTVHADRPELNARMMARLVEVQGTMASLSKAASAASSTIPTSLSPSSNGAGPSSSRPQPPRSLSLSLSLSLPDNSTSSIPHIKTEHPTGTDSFALSLQQRKSRRPGAPLTLSSADIAAANLGAGFHLQGHATAPLPRGHNSHYGHGHGGHLFEGGSGLYTHHESSHHGHGQQHPHSASAHQTHFPSDIHDQQQQYSLDAAPAYHQSHHPHTNSHVSHHAHHHLFANRPTREFTQSEYAVSSHAHGGSPAHEFPFHTNGHVNGVRSQALPSPPYSAASASGYFPSMHQSEGFTVKQEDSPELSGFDLFNQHSQQPHQPQPAYASPPITPHLANFPSLSISGPGSNHAGSLSPHSAFSGGEGSGSPVLGGEVVGLYGDAYDGVSGGGSVYEGGNGSAYEGGNGSGSGSGYEGSLSPEQVFVGVGAEYLHEQHFADGQQQQTQECFEQQSQQEFYPEQQQQFDQQQQQQFFAPAQQTSQQQQQQQQQQDRWMAQQQYRREHGFAA